MALRPGWGTQPWSSSSRQREGVALKAVAWLLPEQGAERGGIGALGLGGDDQPRAGEQGQIQLGAHGVKGELVTETNTSSGSSAGWSLIAQRKLTSERWVISTPLGVPVEPEV